jgi:CBS domain containing-hemolysin-like protein
MSDETSSTGAAGELLRDSGERRGLKERLIRWMVRNFGRHRDNEDTIRDVLGELIEPGDEVEAATVREELALFENIIKLRDLTVEDVMIPRADITAVEIDSEPAELVKMMAEHAHSRLPVYRETLDDVIGMVHIKDVLAHWSNGRGGGLKLADILRKVLVVAPSMRVLDMLLEMRAERTHMAVVVDEFGGIDGLLTIEDLVEEIVGDIDDEHDALHRPVLVERGDGSVEAQARCYIDEFERQYGEIFTEEEREEIDTLGGLVFALAGRVPKRGEVITHPNGVEFEVLEADPRRIKRLRLRNLPAKPDAE